MVLHKKIEYKSPDTHHTCSRCGEPSEGYIAYVKNKIVVEAFKIERKDVEYKDAEHSAFCNKCLMKHKWRQNIKVVVSLMFSIAAFMISDQYVIDEMSGIIAGKFFFIASLWFLIGRNPDILKKRILRRILKRGNRFYMLTALSILSLVISIIGINTIPKLIEGSRINRFFIGVMLLESNDVNARIRGANNLYELANKYELTKMIFPNTYRDYRVDVCEILCEHIRTTTGNDDYKIKCKEYPSKEIQVIMDLLFKKRKYLFSSCKKDLSKSYLTGTNFVRTELWNVNFNFSELKNVHFSDGRIPSDNLLNISYDGEVSKLINVDFSNAKLINNDFRYANLSNVIFLDSTLENVDFRDAILNAIDFKSATLIDVDFSNFRYENQPPYMMISGINFEGTKLDGIDYNTITKKGFSLKLTN